MSENQQLLKARKIKVDAKRKQKALKYAEALKLYQESAEIFRKFDRNHELVPVLHEIGDIHQLTSNILEAKKVFDEALEICSAKIGKISPENSISYRYMGVCLLEMGKFSDAIEKCLHGLEIGNMVFDEDSEENAHNHSNVALCYSMVGNLKKAFRHNEMALSIRKRVLEPGHEDFAETYNNIGFCYGQKGDFDMQFKFHEKALNIQLESIGSEHPYVAMSYNNLGICSGKKGDHDKEIFYLRNARNIYRRIFGEKHLILASFTINLGGAYELKGNFDRALHYNFRAIGLFKELLGEENRIVASCLNNIGSCYEKKGQLKKSLEYRRKSHALRIKLFGNRHPNVAKSHMNIASLLSKSGHAKESLQNYQRAARIWKEHFDGYHPDLGSCYRMTGEHFIENGSLNKALAYFQHALKALAKDFNPKGIFPNPELDDVNSKPGLLRVLLVKAKALFEKGKTGYKAGSKYAFKNLNAALDSLMLATQLIDQLRSTYIFEQSRLTLQSQFAEIYELAQKISSYLYNFTGDREYFDTAFFFAEKGKGNSLLVSLRADEAKVSADIPKDLLEEEKKLRVEIGYYERLINNERVKGERANNQIISEWQSQLFKNSVEYEKLIKKFEQDYKKYFSLKHSSTVSTIADVQKTLKDESILLEYAVTEDCIHIFAISKQFSVFKTIDKPSQFKKTIDDCLNSIKWIERKSFINASHQLYQWLISPIESYLDGKNNLFIIPGGNLYYLPFEVLISSKEANNKRFSGLNYLIKKFSISYHYSSTLIQYERERNRNSSPSADFLGVAPEYSKVGVHNPNSEEDEPSRSAGNAFNAIEEYRLAELAHSRMEIHRISNLFKQRKLGTDSLEGDQATITNFRKIAKRYRFLVIAAHGLVNERNEELSGIVFSNDELSANSSSILYSSESYNLDLQADLVVLSCCETGVGSLAKGEGIVAMNRGFLYAGASNVVFTLFRIYDKVSSDLSFHFFESALKGMSYSKALQTAKIKLIKSEEISPISWAGFVLIGKD